MSSEDWKSVDDDRPVQDPVDGKPSHYQVAWVFRHLINHLRNPGTFRLLIYERMGFKYKVYHTLYDAGGMSLTNALSENDEYIELLSQIAEYGFNGSRVYSATEATANGDKLAEIFKAYNPKPPTPPGEATCSERSKD